MKPSDFHKHCRENAPWVNWQGTTDHFLRGDPEIDISRIAVTWLGTNDVLRRAADKDCNFVIVHEGLFYPQFEQSPSEQKHFMKKRALIDELGLTVFRCHDTWDRFPKEGIVDSWADFLVFPAQPREASSFYRTCCVDGMTVREVAQKVREKTSPLGQEWVSVMGDPERKVSRLAVGTRAITRLPEMVDTGADIFLTTDDGMWTTRDGLWSLDLGNPVITVCHSTSELPGMMNLAKYLSRLYPEVETEYIPCGFPCPSA